MVHNFENFIKCFIHGYNNIPIMILLYHIGLIILYSLRFKVPIHVTFSHLKCIFQRI